MVHEATLGQRITAEAEAGERQIQARRLTPEQAEDAEDAARAENEGYPLGRGGEESGHPASWLRALPGRPARSVATGDKLFSIAADAYGEGSKHPQIVAANAMGFPIRT